MRDRRRSVTHGLSNWYHVSVRPRIIGTTNPSAFTIAFGTAPTFTVVPAASARAFTASRWLTAGAFGTCHGLPPRRARRRRW